MTLYNQMPFPPHEGLPWMSDPPTVDGFVEPDPGITTTQLDAGYTHGGRFAFGGASGVPMAVFQGVKHNSADFMYMGFVARYDQSFDTDDFVMVVLQPSPGAPSAADRRIDVHPVQTGAGAHAAPVDPHDSGPAPLIRTNKPPAAMTVYQRTPGGAHKWQAIGLPAGLECKVRSTQDGTNLFWSVELKIPTTGWMTLASTFGLYFNIGQVYLAPYEMVTQYPWPFNPNSPTANFLVDPVDGSTAPEDWDPPQYGSGLLLHPGDPNPALGVRFLNGAWSIGTLSGGTVNGSANLAEGALNKFVAQLQNTSTNTAPKVRARFRIAEFGISGGLYGNSAMWADLPTPVNTNPAPHAGVDIAGGGGETIELDWTISAADHTTFHTLGADQCLWVQLDTVAPGGAAMFVENSVRRNLWLTNLSNVTHAAVLDASHLDLQHLVKSSHELFLQVAATQVKVVDQTPIEKAFKAGGIEHVSFMPAAASVPVAGISTARSMVTAPLIRENPILTNAIARAPIVPEINPRVQPKKLATWFTAVNGYQVLGNRTLTFAGGKKRRLAVYAGSYGYVAQHQLKLGESIDKLRLSHQLVGPNLKPLGKNMYHVTVAPTEKIQLVNTLKTVPISKLPTPLARPAAIAMLPVIAIANMIRRPAAPQ
jgi:hypothetical protein